MTVVAQADLVNAVSVDELSSLGANPTLSDLLMYVRDGSQATENAKHRKVALDVLRTLLQPTLKTLNSESLFGAGDIVIASGANTPDSAVQTSNFTFGQGGVGWNVPVNLSGGNIVGTLPAVIPNGRIVRVYGRGIASGSANRFSFGLNGGTFNGGPTSLSNITTNFDTAGLSGSGLAGAISHLQSLGLTSVTTNAGATIGIWASGSAFSANNTLQFGEEGEHWLQFTTPVTTNGQLIVRSRSSMVIRVNGSIVHTSPNNITWQAVTTALPDQANVIRFTSPDTFYSDIDNLQITNTPATPPSAWTDAASRNIGPGGYVELQGVTANSTWHVLQRSQLGL
jgi:hypothetical protein